MKIPKFAVLTLIAVLIASFAFFKKDAIACELIGLSHFTQATPNLYIDLSIDHQQQSHLVNSLKEATARVSSIYGTPISNPRIIATAEKTYARFGFNPTGMQSSGLFRECIFLGPKGLNVNVIAHELVHAEVRHRTDLFVELTQLPAWFIEGTGIKADHRQPFLDKNIHVNQDEVAKIKALFYLHDFPNTEVGYYQASLIAIEPMNPKNLYAGLERLNNGEQFKDVFPELF